MEMEIILTSCLHSDISAFDVKRAAVIGPHTTFHTRVKKEMSRTRDIAQPPSQKLASLQSSVFCSSLSREKKMRGKQGTVATNSASEKSGRNSLLCVCGGTISVKVYNYVEGRKEFLFF